MMITVPQIVKYNLELFSFYLPIKIAIKKGELKARLFYCHNLF